MLLRARGRPQIRDVKLTTMLQDINCMALSLTSTFNGIERDHPKHNSICMGLRGTQDGMDKKHHNVDSSTSWSADEKS